MRIMNRWEPNTLREQINRVLADVLERRGEESNLTTWAPAVDIFETEHELVVKADLPDVDPKDLDIQIQNNILTIRGERKFEKNLKEENYLRIERAYLVPQRALAEVRRHACCFLLIPVAPAHSFGIALGKSHRMLSRRAQNWWLVRLDLEFSSPDRTRTRDGSPERRGPLKGEFL